MSLFKRWILSPPPPHTAALADKFSLSHLQARLLANRGIDQANAETFLSPRLSDITDPMMLKDMDAAIWTILQAVENQKQIIVFGDYDADGLTATALLFNFFTDIGIPVSSYIPNRLTEGYGLNREAIRRFSAQGVGLIITVDCGSADGSEVALARELGMEVVVTDHHQLPEDFRAFCPVVNPNRPDCPFPFKGLSGVGLAFYLAIALRGECRRKGWFKSRPEPDLRDYLDLVALGTVADRVPLLGENRTLVKRGMGVLANSRWPGITALSELANVSFLDISADDLAFRLAPRLNAPGRVGDPLVGLHVLTVKGVRRAREFAMDLDRANGERQGIQAQILREIEGGFHDHPVAPERRTLMVSGRNWHPGVLGIVASRLTDTYHRPVLVFNVQDGIAVGSGRSIEGFNLYKALSRLGHLLERFGGHARAAGLSLKARNLEMLDSDLEALAGDLICDEDLVPSIGVDAELSFRDISPAMVNQIAALSPFGEGNPNPLFYSSSLEVLESRIVGNGHLKLVVRQGKGPLRAIGFNMAGLQPKRGRQIRMVYTPELDRWRGHNMVQLRIVDLCDEARGSVDIFGAEDK